MQMELMQEAALDLHLFPIFPWTNGEGGSQEAGSKRMRHILTLAIKMSSALKMISWENEQREEVFSLSLMLS